MYSLLFSADELLSDSFPYKELFNGALWEVEGKVSISNFVVPFIFAPYIMACKSSQSCQIFNLSPRVSNIKDNIYSKNVLYI